MQLVIVESPTKARKLRGYLGSGYQIEASVGHIRDLPKNGLSIDIENNFEPTYEISADKKDVVKKLKQLAASADKVILATDPDREGEAISWHLRHLITSDKKSGKKDSDFVRATFHEITKKAVVDAIEHSGQINMSLVDAQQARRVVDRLVGYQVSPILWKKVRRGLSAGRVQSVALRLIVEREREIEAFKPEEYWEVDVALDVTSGKVHQVFIDSKPPEKLPEGMLIARVVAVAGQKFEPHTEADVSELKNWLPQAEYTIAGVERTQRQRVSLPPFTTSTLQQKAATSLGYTSKATMRLAQQLYEEGLITYHRTDSVNLSQDSIVMARSFIEKEYGHQYLPASPRVFKAQSKNAQEAHEAVRVTDLTVTKQTVLSKGLTEQHAKLYDLIWRRFVASQMQPAVYDQTTITVDALSGAQQSAQLRCSGSIITFDGWMKLFPGSEDTVLPNVSQGQPVFYTDSSFAQKFTQPPARYNDASLVKELEKRGVGRPSTYASIISVIETRGYIERQQKRFFATAIGKTVCDFLVQYFPVFMEYEFTAEMEEDLDRISRGEKEWRAVVSAFYTPFKDKLKTADDTAERAKVPVEETGEPCPLCHAEHQGMIVIRTGRFGKFKSCSRYPECKFTQNIVETVPDVLCPLCQEGQVVVKNSRWGKQFYGCSRYPECEWAHWKKPEPGEKLSAAEWKMMQEARAERKAKFEAKKAAAAPTTKAKAIKSSAKTAKKPAKKSTAKKTKTTKK